jgi:predicted transcriptional regulator
MTNPVATQNLQRIAERLRANDAVESVTVREFLSWFGAKRRGYWVVEQVRQELEKTQLETEPDFEGTYIDTPIRFTPQKLVKRVDETAQVVALEAKASLLPEIASTDISKGEIPDPTHRISKLAAANRTPVTVPPDAQLATATTTMLVKGFSQLPVMTSTRDVKGVISWQSIGDRVARGVIGTTVREMMDPQYQEVRYDASLFQAIPAIVANDYVLVRAKDNTISGIVTASDLSIQFLQLSEPFLLLGEIENHLRQIISDAFSVSDLEQVQDIRDTSRKVASAADLNFGEYKALLDHQDRWLQSKLPWDRRVFCDQIDAIREIRNDVMHFDPDPLTEADLQTLREFARFLQRSVPSKR